MKSFKKAVATILVMALCLTGVCYQNQTAKAATATPLLTQKQVTVMAGTPFTHTFQLNSASDVGFMVYAAVKTQFTWSIQNSAGTNVVAPKTVSATDLGWETYTTQSGSIVDYYGEARLNAAGTYTIKFEFAESQNIIIDMAYLALQTATLDFNSITVTKGFTGKVTVLNAGSATATFTSNNTAVATVDSKGIVTGKKKGNAVITVKLSTGQTLTCNVAVKDNVYSVKQLSGNQVSVGVTVDVYKISYDKKGNLVIKTRVINKSGRKVKSLKNLKITVKNGNGKKIGVFSKKKMAINLKNKKSKAYTFKIKKSKVKAKQDLRNISSSDIKVSGKYIYVR